MGSTTIVVLVDRRAEETGGSFHTSASQRQGRMGREKRDMDIATTKTTKRGGDAGERAARCPTGPRMNRNRRIEGIA